MPYFVYFLECSDKTIYVGVTGDLDKRVLQHAGGHFIKCYTFNRRPVNLIYFEEHQWIEVAILAEKKYKKWSGQKKRALAEGRKSDLKELSKRRT